MSEIDLLAEYFRGSDVHQRLPTGGQFFTPGTIDLAINGEVAILPMTAVDEIIVKNPDALMNGDALERLFASCVPGIKEPRRISVPDMDVLLLAIKLASYGDNLDITVECPKCQHEFTQEKSIREILDHLSPIDFKKASVRVNEDIVAHLKPYDFEAKTKLDLAAFEEAKLFEHLLDLDASEEDKRKLMNRSFEKIAELNLDLLGLCIVKLDTPKGEVTDPLAIRTLIRRAHRKMLVSIREGIQEISRSAVDRKVEVTCPQKDCGHQWQTEMSFDPASFFA
jgi:hypothetical protein